MSGVLRVTAGVEFTLIAPAGFHILSILDELARDQSRDLILTSACDGAHSGPGDPHHLGEAYDVRSHDFPEEEKPVFLKALTLRLGPGFYAFLEDPGLANEHFHVQLRHGATYP